MSGAALPSAGRAPAPGDVLRVRVRRHERGIPGELHEFKVPYRKWMRVLDALDWIAENALPDLAYSWYCGSKMCGTCAVRMNGREVLTCWEAAEADMLIEPLRHYPVLRDLVVDRTPFERRLAAVEPWIERTASYAGFPEPLSHKDMEHASKALDCIACLACDSACPVLGQADPAGFPGPATIVQLGQTALDPRNDRTKVARVLGKLAVIDCVSCRKCEEVCPARIPIVSAVIEPLKAKAAALLPYAGAGESAVSRTTK